MNCNGDPIAAFILIQILGYIVLLVLLFQIYFIISVYLFHFYITIGFFLMFIIFTIMSFRVLLHKDLISPLLLANIIISPLLWF